MTPCDINVTIAAITNSLYCSLSKEDFVCLSIFLNELSKSMISTTLFENLCTKKEGKSPVEKFGRTLGGEGKLR